MLQWLKNAFAVDSPGPLTPSDAEREVVDWLAAAIVRRRLQTPAILLLESSAPLNFLASQLLVLAAPAAELFVHQGRYEALQTLLERRGSVDYICRRIEALADPPRSLLSSEPGHRAT